MAEIVVDKRPTYSYWYGPETFIGRVVNLVIGLIELVLALRLVLELLGASSAAPFVATLYRLTDPLVAPFAGAFGALQTSVLFIDLSTLFAMIGYAIIGWLFLRIVALLEPVY